MHFCSTRLTRHVSITMLQEIFAFYVSYFHSLVYLQKMSCRYYCLIDRKHILAQKVDEPSALLALNTRVSHWISDQKYLWSIGSQCQAAEINPTL